jgi:hypothetical protein
MQREKKINCMNTITDLLSVILCLTFVCLFATYKASSDDIKLSNIKISIWQQVVSTHAEFSPQLKAEQKEKASLLEQRLQYYKLHEMIITMCVLFIITFYYIKHMDDEYKEGRTKNE